MQKSTCDIQQLIENNPPIVFTSVHDYLDELFLNYDPSKKDISKAKKAYWSAYNKDLKKRQSKTSQVFGIRLSDYQVKHLQSRCQMKHLTPFIKSIVLAYLEDDAPIKLDLDTRRLEQELHHISQQLEELILNDAVLDKPLQLQLLSTIEELETQINNR